MKPNELQQRRRALGLASLWYFGNAICGLQFEEDAHGDIIKALEEGDFDEMLVLMARGHYKTHLIAVYVAWRIVGDRNLRALFVASNDEYAGRILGVVQQLLELPAVVELYGKFKSPSLPWNTLELVCLGRTKVLKEPTVSITGLSAFKPGGHYDIVVWDDPEDQDSVNTPELLAKTRTKDALSAPMTDEPGAKRITLGTIYSEADLYCHKVESFGLFHVERDEEGVERKLWKNNVLKLVRVDEDTAESDLMRVRFFYKPIFKDDGSALLPSRFTPKNIARLKASMKGGVTEWNRQYLLLPVSGDNATFTKADFRYVSVAEGKHFRYVLGGDFASSTRYDSDETAFVLVSYSDTGLPCVREVVKGKYSTDELYVKLIAYHLMYPGIIFALEEDNYAKGWRKEFERECSRRGVFPRVTWIKAGSRPAKEQRIAALQGFFRTAGATLMPAARAIEDEGLVFPHGRRKDGLDALANAFELAQKSFGSDTWDHLGARDAMPEAPWNRRRRFNQPYLNRRGDKVPWKAS